MQWCEMKEKLLILELLGILLILLTRLCFLHTNIDNNLSFEDNDYAITVRNPNLEDPQIAKKAQVKEKLVSEKKTRYLDLYPDMYVEAIKPVIRVEEKKTAYLTFDDGPSSITGDILNILDEYDVKATFFILGCTMTEDGADFLKTMVDQGHTIGIHTYSHNRKKIYASVESFLDDFYQDYKLIYEVTGRKVNIFRFPWGSCNSYNKPIMKEIITEMERRGFTYYDWNVSAEDSIGKPTKQKIEKNIMKDLVRFNDPIILLHDASVNKITAKTLPDIIELILDNGYGFSTLDKREPYQFRKNK